MKEKSLFELRDTAFNNAFYSYNTEILSCVQELVSL